MQSVATGFVIVAAVVAVGYVLQRFGTAGGDAGGMLSQLAFFVFTPALMFVTLAHADVRAVFSSTLLVAAASAAAAAALSAVVSALVLKRSISEVVIAALCSSYVNANNIGLPVATYVLGNSALVAPVLLLQLVVFAPLALMVLDLSTSGRVTARRVLTLPLRNPTILASLAGIAVALLHLGVPTIITAPLALIGGAAVPAVLLAFGMSLYGSVPMRAPGRRADVVIAVVIKSVVMPVLAFIIARFAFGLSGAALLSTVTLASLPAAQNVFVYARQYERGVALARDAVLVSSAVALPVMLAVSVLVR